MTFNTCKDILWVTLKVSQRLSLWLTVNFLPHVVCYEYFTSLHNVLSVCVQKYEYQNILNYDFACCFVLVWNLVCHIAWGMWAEGGGSKRRIEIVQWGDPWFLFLTSFYPGDHIKKNEMGRSCGMCGGRSGVYTVLVGKPGERNCLEDPGVDGRIILNWISLQHSTNRMHSVIP